MAFFNSSGSVDEVVLEDNGDYVDYGDDSVPYGEEYDGNLPSNGLDEKDAMYYSEAMGNDDLNYEDGLGGEDHTNMETNYEQETTTNEEDTLPQPESETQDRTVAPKKNFFGSRVPSVKSKPNRSSFFGISQNATAAPRATTPPFSYISSDSSCGSTDSLVLSGESAEESHSAAAFSGIALTTTQTAATEDTNHTPVRCTSQLQDSAIAPPEAAQHVDKVAKQLFSSPTAVKTSGGTNRAKPTAAAAAKSVAPASAPAAARVSTAPFPFLRSVPLKFGASTFPAPSFGSFSSASFTPSFGGSANKKTFTAATAGSSKPPLSSAPSPQQQSAPLKPKQKVKTKAKSVTFQTGTKTAKEPSATPVTPMSSADAALSVERPLCADSCAERQSSPTDTAPTPTSFVPVTPVPHSSMLTTTASDRAVLHQVTPDSSTNHQQRKQNGDNDDEVHQPHTEYGDRDGIVSPVASRASRTVSTEEDHDSSGYSAVRAVEPTTLSSPAVYDSGTILSLTLDTAQALSLCEQQMDPQAEELRDRLRSARDTVRESRAAMVQNIHSTARTHTQYLVEDSVGSAAPELMELQRKMEQLRLRYKAIETAREQLCVPMEVE